MREFCDSVRFTELKGFAVNCFKGIVLNNPHIVVSTWLAILFSIKR